MKLVVRGRFPRLLESHMDNLGYTRKELAAKTGKTVEHMRKLLMGEAFPGPELQRSLAEVLKMDLATLERIVADDRWFKKHRKYPPASAKVEPLSPVERHWNELSVDQQEELACIAECMVKRNRKRAAGR